MKQNDSLAANSLEQVRKKASGKGEKEVGTNKEMERGRDRKENRKDLFKSFHFVKSMLMNALS